MAVVAAVAVARKWPEGIIRVTILIRFSFSIESYANEPNQAKQTEEEREEERDGRGEENQGRVAMTTGRERRWMAGRLMKQGARADDDRKPKRKRATKWRHSPCATFSRSLVSFFFRSFYGVVPRVSFLLLFRLLFAFFRCIFFVSARFYAAARRRQLKRK